ncbi:MAG: TIR domain-containing protein, partial [Cyanobacteria bacterium P01_E01_bin.35]
MTRIFISHSHSDQAIAFRLVNFLLAALRVEEEEILCTSNPDQGLAYSSHSITDQLKHELKTSEAIIILITLDSLHSAWIPFEAGSFWTTDKPVIPILGKGLTQNDLPGPLKSFLSIAIETPDFADKLNSAINQLADKLQIEQRFTTRRNHTLEEFSQHLKDWQPKHSNKNNLQQHQIELLTRELEDIKATSEQEKEQIKRSYQTQ